MQLNSHVDASLKTTVLTSSRDKSIAIYPNYPHRFYVLLSPITLISHTSFNNTLFRVTLEACIGWTSVWKWRVFQIIIFIVIKILIMTFFQSVMCFYAKWNIKFYLWMNPKYIGHSNTNLFITIFCTFEEIIALLINIAFLTFYILRQPLFIYYGNFSVISALTYN